MTLYDYWMVVYRRRLLVLVTVASAMTLAWAASARITPVYQAVAEFYVAEAAAVAPLLSTATAGAAGLPQPALPVILQERERSYVGILESAVIESRVHASVPDKDRARLQRDVDVQATRNHLVRVRVRDPRPDVAAAVANAYPAALNAMLGDISQQRRARSAEVLRTAARERRARLDAARGELNRFLVQSGTADVKRETEELVKRKAVAETDHDRAVAALKQVEQRIQEAEGRLEREAKVFVSSQSAASSDLAQRLQKDISDVQADLAAARTRYTDKHPRVKRLVERLEHKKADLGREMERTVSGEAKLSDSFYERLRRQVVEMYVERAALGADVAAKTSALGDLAHRSESAPPVRLREEQLRAEVASLQRMADAAMLGYQEALAQAASRPDEVVVVREASPPAEAMFPLPLVNVTVAAMLGTIAGVYLAFFVEYVTRVTRRAAWATT